MRRKNRDCAPLRRSLRPPLPPVLAWRPLTALDAKRLRLRLAVPRRARLTTPPEPAPYRRRLPNRARRKQRGLASESSALWKPCRDGRLSSWPRAQQVALALLAQTPCASGFGAHGPRLATPSPILRHTPRSCLVSHRISEGFRSNASAVALPSGRVARELWRGSGVALPRARPCEGSAARPRLARPLHLQLHRPSLTRRL